MTEIIAYHGWAYTADDWSEWSRRLNSDQITFRAAERGYFSEPLPQDFREAGSHKILICHSYGLHWVPKKQLNDIDVLVLLNSFQSLSDPVILGIRNAEKLSKTIRAMELKLRSAPYRLLSDFRKLCGYKDPAFELQIWDESKLRGDLDIMRSEGLEHLKEIEVDKLILIEAEKDRVVPESRLKNFQNTASQLVHHVVEGSGHALPFTHPDICISLIKEGIPILENYESGKYYSGK